ncbi:MAG: VWA domain-containing protein [Bacteroidota bacterium]
MYNLKIFLIPVLFLVSSASLLAQAEYSITDTGGTPQGPITYGDVEVLLSSEVELLLNNIGSGLTILAINNITLEQNGLVDYTTHWTLRVEDDLGNPIDFLTPITSGYPLHIFLTFAPAIDAPGSAMTINLLIDSNSEANPQMNNIIVSGTATKTVINYSLVIDRSGSMRRMEDDGIGGTKRRIDLLSEAADYFLGLEYLRVENTAIGFPGDQIGIVKYNHNVDGTYLPLSTATNTLISDAQTNLVSTTATNDLAFIEPQGNTATGNAVIEALNNQLTTVASGAEQNVIIMLSDGYENTGSLISDIGAGSVSDVISLRPDVNIYSIGMGSANMASLEQYSSLSGLSTPQTFYYDPTLDPLALNSFFFKIYQNAIGLASVVDPTYYVNITSQDWIDIAEALISSSDQQITISITYPEEINEVTDYQIIQPSGIVLAEGNVGGLNTIKIEGRNHIIYQVTYSNAADPADYVGEWKLQGKSTSEARSDINLSNVPVGFAIASLSGLTIDVNAGTGNIEPGDEIVVTTEPEDSTNPDDEVEIEEVDVTITTPDGKEVGCPPEKDPCGTYVVKYPYTHKEGIYEVYVKTILKNSKGERTMRDAYQQVVVSNNKEILSSDTKPCLVCKWIQVLIVISIIILILILILLIRKRKG